MPGQSSGLLAGASPAEVTVSHRLRTEPCMPEVTTGMMRGQGKCQAVTRVNVLSPEISNITEADLLHLQGRRNDYSRKGKAVGTLSGSEATAWYEGKPGNPGRARRNPS